MGGAMTLEREAADGRRGGASPERRCIVTREAAPRDGMIRFAVSPDGVVVPDLEERLPGRGLWLTARGDIVRRACDGNSFARALRRAVTVPDGLPERLDALLSARCLDLLALARRSGDAVCGFEKVRAALAGGGVAVLLASSDAGPDGRRKLARFAAGVTVLDLWSADELGGPFGRGATVHVAVAAGGIAARLQRDARRLAGLRSEG